MLFGSTQLHPQYNSLKTKITEWLGNGTLSPTFTVSGHSMGGFLGFTINTVKGWIGFAETYDQSKISNIEAATGISPILGLGFDAAPPIDIIIEDQMAPDISDPPSACNHSQLVLTTDGFSRLYRVFPIGAEPGAGATQQTDGCFRFDQGCQWSIQQ